jgi:hypothetical protein
MHADWLDRIGPALARQDYQGTLVTVSGNSIDTLGVFHAWDDGRERMRLVALTGPKREVIRDDKHGDVHRHRPGLGRLRRRFHRWNPAGKFAEAGKLPNYRRTHGQDRARRRARLPGRRPAAEGPVALRLSPVARPRHRPAAAHRAARRGGRRSSRWPSPS